MGREPVEYAIGLAGEMGILPELGVWVARQAFAQLRARGLRLSLDDFGSGYSSLSYLRALPVTTIKVESLLRDVPGNADANAVLRAVGATGA